MDGVQGAKIVRTVIMLSRITDPAVLPAEPLITTVTLAELTVAPWSPEGRDLVKRTGGVAFDE
jgi:hypothetical protein